MKFDPQQDTEQRVELIQEALQEHSRSCHDMLGTVEEFTYVNEDLCLRGGEPTVIAQMTKHAESQLLTRLRIPASYLHRCPPFLQRANISHWLLECANQNILLRFKDDTIRAIFSNRYKSDMDDAKVMPVILEALQQELGDDLHIKTFHQTEDFTIMKILFRDARTQHESNISFAGVTIVNSEVGKSSLWIKPIVRNGNEFGAFDFIDSNYEGSTAFRHTGELKIDKIRAALTLAKQVAEVGIYRVFEASKEIVDNPAADVKALVETSDFLTQNLVDIIEEEYQNTLEATKLQVAQSMLKAVSTLPLFKRHLAEKAVGRYLDLFGDTNNRLDNIVQDLNNLEEESVPANL